MAESLSNRPTWFVQPCRRHAGGADHNSWRVQRWVQLGHQGAYEMAFVNSNHHLCLMVAELLNCWDVKKEGEWVAVTLHSRETI